MTSPQRLLALLFLTAVLTTSCERLEQPLAFDPAVMQGTLSNGIKYYVRENDKPDGRLELRLVVRAGSVLEDDDQQGLAHFLEHMAFNGTEHYDKQELIDYLEGIGMRFGPDLNAYTSFDETVYKLQIPTEEPDAMDAAFTILRDWAVGLRNESAEMDKERGVVIEEWRGRRGAGQRIWDEHYKVLYHDSRYASRMPIGKKEVLDSFAHDRLRDFYKKWYQPQLMAIIAVGDADATTIEQQIRKHFGGIPATPAAADRPDFEVPRHASTLISIVTDEEATSSFVGVYYKRDVQHTRTVADYRDRLIETLFTHMLSGRLDEKREQADAPFLNGYAYTGRYIKATEFFGLGAEVNDNGWLRGMKAVLAEGERARRYGFTPGELERTKAVLLSGVERAYNERDTTDSKSYASSYRSNFTRNTISTGVETKLELYRKLLPEIELIDIMALAETFITDTNRVVLLHGPRKEGVTIPSEAALHSVFSEIAQLALEPYVDDVDDEPLVPDLPPPGKIAGTEEIEDLDVTILTLSNGSRILLKPTTFKQDEIVFHAYSPGGHSLAADADFIAAASADTVMDIGGWGSYSTTQLGKRLAGKTVSVSPYIGELSEGLRGSCRPVDLEVMMQLIHLKFTAPRMDKDAYEAYLTRLRTDLGNRLARPEAVYQDAVQVTMSQGHKRRKPWTPETLEAMDLQRSQELFKERFSGTGDFSFVFVGNFEVAQLQSLALKYIGSLPGRPKEQWRDLGIRPPTGIVKQTVQKGVDPKSKVTIIYTGELPEWSYQQRYWIYAMTSVLRIKLREEMREEIGGTYGVGVSAAIEHYPTRRYAIHIAFGCAPDQVDTLIDVAHREIGNIQNGTIDDSYLTKVKQTQLREREVGLERNSFWLHIMHYYDWHNEGIRTVNDFENYVSALTADDVRKSARQCFRTSNVATLILRPEAE
jgi:zinc protease